MQAETPAPRPLARRIVDTFVAPRRLAASFRETHPWQGPLLITTLVAVAAAAALPAEYFLEQLENPVNRLGRPVTVTSSPEEIVRWGRYLQMFSALVEHPVVILMVAGLVTLLFSVLGGGRVGMRSYLALTSHAFLISALGLLLTVAWHLVTGDAEAQPSLAFLAGGRGGGALARLLGVLNPFTLWMLLVLAVGVDELDERRSLPAAAAVLFGLYLVLAVVVAAMS